MRDRQRDLANLEEKWEGRQMPPTATAEKQRLHEEISAAQERLGGTLAQWRINQILYPEYTHLLSIGNPRESALLKTYEQTMKMLRLDIYFRESIDYYKKQLDLLGIPPGAQQMDYVRPHVEWPARAP